MRSRSNGGIIGNYQLPTNNHANGVFFIHDAAIYNTGLDPIWPLGAGLIYSASGGTISTAVNDDNYQLHTFTSNGTFTVTTGSAFVDILLVGGGGSGGRAYSASTSYDLGAGGGGGGGRVMLAEGVWVNAGTTFTVEVGQGGLVNDLTEALAYGLTDARLTGKPSKVTSNAGHSFSVFGGSYGGSGISASFYMGANGGAGEYARYNAVGTQTSSTINGSYTTAQQITRTSTTGGDAATEIVNSGGTNYLLFSGGGGAGWEDGYHGKYTTDLTKSSNGGQGFQWDRTGYYYGGGGAGGGSYGWPNGSSQRRSGYFGNSSYRLGAWAYYNQSSSNDGDAGVDGYGLGGSGGACGLYVSTTLSGDGGAGGNGTVIFCYRYK